MTSQPGQQTISINTLRNTPGSNDNRAIKFGQSIEYNMSNTFVEKSYTKCWGEIIPGLFLTNQN